MKQLLIILLSLGLVSGAYAQRGGHGGGGHYYGGGHAYYAPRVVVGVGGYYPYYGYGLGLGLGLGYGYYPWGLPYYGYNPYAYGPNSSRSAYNLDMEIQSIKTDYKHQIKETRHDKSLIRSERKAKIRDLKYQRDQAITNAKREYYYNQTHRQQQPNTYRPQTQPNQGQQNQQQQQPSQQYQQQNN